MNHSGTFLTTRSAEDVFDLVADPRRFGPLLPDFESMELQDATHFTMRIVIAVGAIQGHVNLAMELRQAARADRVEYRGQGIVAGSQLTFAMQFHLAPAEGATEVSWQGEVSVNGMLALMAGSMIDELGRRNFDAMVEQLQNKLRENATTGNRAPAALTDPELPRF
jgi:carbon monoxide dehydrogenase subunit G